MASQVPEAVTSWLQRVLEPEYQDPARTFHDTVGILSEQQSLRPRTNVYTDESGRPELLLCIFGTIPAYFSNNVYRIPVEFWVPKSYPVHPPFAFVRPTSNMIIHPGNHVDANGRCYHPYISYWDHTHSLIEFVRILSTVFSKEPPVYAKPPPSYQPAPSYNSQIPSQTPSPQAPPDLPPKPTLPQYSIQEPNQYRGQDPASGPVPGPVPGPPQQQPMPATESVEPQSRPPQAPAHPSFQRAPLQGAVQASPYPQSRRSTVPDIMDMDNPAQAQNQTPPPPPPNPERMRTIEEFEKALKEAEAELTREREVDDHALEHTEQALSWIAGELQDQKAQLERISKGCKDNQQILTDKIAQAQNLIQEAKNRRIPNVDDVVCAENVVYNQLYTLVAEDNVIDDTVYVLASALDRDKIQLETFIKHARSLAREQFLNRALVQKISATAGLDQTT
uniref:ARAD1C34210p n=1 Tax=Blastobotrys adeninivorans TaxID=409370 RepID=A0A060T873_BLAAD